MAYRFSRHWQLNNLEKTHHCQIPTSRNKEKANTKLKKMGRIWRTADKENHRQREILGQKYKQNQWWHGLLSVEACLGPLSACLRWIEGERGQRGGMVKRAECVMKEIWVSVESNKNKRIKLLPQLVEGWWWVDVGTPLQPQLATWISCATSCSTSCATSCSTSIAQNKKSKCNKTGL